MRVLWICNRAIPAVSKHLNIKSDNKEGWLAGLSEKMLSNKKDNITLGICFPVPLEQAEYKGEYEVTAYGFYEDPVHFEIYDDRLEERFAKIYDDFKPDELTTLQTDINTKTTEYESDFASLESEIQSFNNCANTIGCFTNSSFNAKRNELISKQNTINQNFNNLNQLIDQYNQKVEEYNKAIEENRELTAIINPDYNPSVINQTESQNTSIK